METLTVRKLASQRIRQGYKLLETEDFVKTPKISEGKQFQVQDQNGKFLGTAYFGKEKKSIGWVISTDSDEEALDIDFFQIRFVQAKEERNSFYQNLQETDAFRVFNGDGDGIGGLIIDYYGGFYLISWYNKGLLAYRDQLIEAFENVFSDALGVYEKHNYPNAKVQSYHSFGQEASEPHLIKENGIQFSTYLNEGWMTGIFLDQRDVRRRLIDEYAAGKTVLNLFSYTGAFSVASAMGGAIKTVSIDSANRSKPLTTEQFEVNQLDVTDHEIRVIDSYSYIDYAKKHGLLFDIIVVDPPTFARSKKGTWNVEEDYSDLIAECLKILNVGGLLITSTNSWKLNRDEFFELVSEGVDQEGTDMNLLEEFTLPSDFKVNPAYVESDYLKVFVLEKSAN